MLIFARTVFVQKAHCGRLAAGLAFSICSGALSSRAIFAKMFVRRAFG